MYKNYLTAIIKKLYLGVKGAPPLPHSSYISGSQTQPSRSKTRTRGKILLAAMVKVFFWKKKH
jgi:hypothetical protein